MRQKARPGPAPRVRAARMQVLVEGLERRDGLPHVERAGHEDDRQHDRGLGEREVDAERRDLLAEEAEAAERGQQADARDRGREHQRQLDERDDDAAAGEAPPSHEVGGGGAHQQRDPEGDGVRLGRDDQGVLHDRIVEVAERLARGALGEERDDRDRQERQGRHQRQQQDEGERAQPAHAQAGPPARGLGSGHERAFGFGFGGFGKRKPASAMSLRPTLPVARATKARAAALLPLDVTTAIS